MRTSLLVMLAAGSISISGLAYAGPPAKAVANAANAGINLTETIMSNAGAGNGGEYGSPGPVVVTDYSEVNGPLVLDHIDMPNPNSNPNSWTYVSTQTNTEVTSYEQVTPEIDPGKSQSHNQSPEAGDDVDAWTITTTQTNTITDAPGTGQDSTVEGPSTTTCTGDCPA